MTLPDIELPDDVEALKAMVLAMAEKAARVEALEKQVDDLEARNADADERIERLTQILKAFDRACFGRRSEKLGSSTVDDEQHAFVFEEIETGIAAIKAQVTKGRGSWTASALHDHVRVCAASRARRGRDRTGRPARACG